MITQRPDKSSVVIVISLLSSLMFDQKACFAPRGISAEFLGELQQDRKAVEWAKMGKHQLVLAAMLHRILR